MLHFLSDSRVPTQALRAAGLREMPACELQDVLDVLKAKWAAAYASYQQLPLVLDLPSQRRRKEALEHTLDSLQQEIATLQGAQTVLVVDD